MTIFYLALKDLRLLGRDPMALFWSLGFPLLFAFFLGGVVRAGSRGEPVALDLLVFDEAASLASGELVEALARQPGLRIQQSSREAGPRAVRRAEALGYLEVPEHWGDRVPLRLGLDPSREVEGIYLQNVLVQTARAVQAKDAVAIARSERALLQTMAIELPSQKRNEAELVFPVAALWGLLGCAASFAIAMVAERTRGTFVRLVAAPVPRGLLLGGKALACLIACLVVLALLTLVAVLGFKVPLERPGHLVLAAVSAAVCFVGITMLLGLLGRTEQSVAGAGWGVLILMAMIGGGMVPLSMMPEWLYAVSHWSPVKWSIVALEGATWRGFSMRELLVPCSILMGLGALGLGIGSRVLKQST